MNRTRKLENHFAAHAALKRRPTVTDKTLEEKKLVAEKLMGWKSEDDSFQGRIWRDANGMYHVEREWNPQSDLSCWPEIWEILWERGLSGQYLGNLIRPLTRNKHRIGWEIHTAPAVLCWKALIETLEA